ncbi:MAG: DUF4179 domain-containing protein [Ruminococcaceae bacterium]|nr:DUF4179 domain-containing protein [Oscillospiraceae bacterium]
MTDYRGIFGKAFSNIAPAASEEAAVREIFEKGRTMNNKKTSSKRIITAAVAATAALSISGAAFAAANGWDIASAFAQMFSSRAESSELGSHSLEVDLQQYAQPLDIVQEYERFTLHITGIAADKFSAYMLYDLTFHEDIPTDGDWRKFVQFSVDGKPMAASGADGVLSQEGNTLYCYAAWLFDGEQIGSLAGRTLNVAIKDITHYYSTEDAVSYLNADTDISTDIPVDFEIIDSGICIEPNAPMTIYNRECTLTKLELTPFSIWYSIEGLEPEMSGSDDYMSISYTYTNGEQSGNHGCISSRYVGEERIVSALFGYPVAFEEIESVTIGDTVIPLK